MGTQTVPPALFNEEMPDPLQPETPATPTPDTPPGNQAPAAPAASAPGDQTPATPANGAPPAAPAAPATPELVKMPDGRELTAAEAVKEMKDNFLPEYTRVTQELARLKPSLPTQGTTPEPPKHPWEDPEWVPGSTKELLDAAVSKLEVDQAKKAEADAAAVAQVRNEIEAQLATLKAKDPQLNEEQLFAHANKYKFMDLTVAYENMVEIRTERKKAADEAAQARAERAAEPVNGTPAAPGSQPGGVDWDHISGAANTLELVQEMLARGK